MIIQNVKPNTDEWIADRRKYKNASEASIMMGASANVTRNELLFMKTTGLDQEFSDWVQKNVLDYGHDVERLARPIAEEIIGEELYPVSATDDEGRLRASFDGQTMLEDKNWECKQWNKQKAADVEAGKVPECDYWQLVHQQAVNPGSETLYMVTDGTKEKCVHVWFKASDDDIKRLNAGWKQFDEDAKQCVPKAKAAEAKGDKPDSLPALVIAVEGAVTDSNLPAFKERALAMVASVKTDLKTDKDFADAAELVKAFKAGEDELESAKKRALSQTASIEELFRTVDDVKEKMRKKRLELNKLVTEKKEARKLEILQSAQKNYDDFMRSLDVARYMPAFSPDFAGAMKNKRTISSLQDACDDLMAQSKIEANEVAATIRGNLQQIDEHASDYRFLFNDFGQICQKPADDFAAIVKARIADHKEAEQKRLDAEREKIRQEEEAKAKRAAEEDARRAVQAEADSHKAKLETAAEADSADKKPAHELPPLDFAKPESEQITISVEEYERLKHNSEMYLALAAAGVDNWEGYALAMEILQEAA